MSRQSSQVHRFRHYVAVCLPDGPTQYLTEKQARQLVKALLGCAQDIKKNPLFVDSEFSTTVIPMTGEKE